jgi:hypothetical protein
MAKQFVEQLRKRRRWRRLNVVLSTQVLQKISNVAACRVGEFGLKLERIRKRFSGRGFEAL